MSGFREYSIMTVKRSAKIGVELIKTLENAGISVRPKDIRIAWYENKAENNSMRKLGETKERRKKKRQGDNKDNQGR